MHFEKSNKQEFFMFDKTYFSIEECKTIKFSANKSTTLIDAKILVSFYYMSREHWKHYNWVIGKKNYIFSQKILNREMYSIIKRQKKLCCYKIEILWHVKC